MTHSGILTLAALLSTAVAIVPAGAQHVRGAAAPSANVSAGAPAPSAGMSTQGAVAGPRVSASTSAGVSANTSATVAPSTRTGTTFNWGTTFNSRTRFNSGVAANTWNGGTWNGNRSTWNGSWDGNRHNRFSRGPGFAFGFGVAPYYYDDYAYAGYPYDDTYAYYGDDAYVVGGATADPGYCARRYRSYDPASGTFLGYDGLRHPCP